MSIRVDICGAGLTIEFATAARVRHGLAKARDVELVLNERDGMVGRWASGDFEFWLGRELAFGLRPKATAMQRMIRESRVALGKFCW